VSGCSVPVDFWKKGFYVTYSYQRAYWVNRLNPKDIEDFRKSMNSLLEKSANETVTAMEKFEQPFPAEDQRVGGFSLSYFEPADVDG
jgi:hypothetical protein